MKAFSDSHTDDSHTDAAHADEPAAYTASHNHDARRFLDESRAHVERRLHQLVPNDSIEPCVIHEAMRYSLFAGGKRFRPALVIAVGTAFNVPLESLLDTACAFEMLHTYSLIHDDLPAMDDDDLRRGQPTCHKRFGEAMAILAGDALQTLAFQIIADDDRLSSDVRVRLISELAHAAGTPHGMIAGQVRDLAAATHEIKAEELARIHAAKTGALIRAAACSGALIGNARDAELDAVGTYAARLGLLFQITDDILDVTSTAAEIGKTPGKDAHQQKATYPALYGMKQARRLARTAHDDALHALDDLAQPTAMLRSIVRLVLERRA